MSENNKYYIAYCFQSENRMMGYGNMTITNEQKLSIETLEDIKVIEEYVKDEIYKREKENIYNVVIMDFRKLESEEKDE